MRRRLLSAASAWQHAGVGARLALLHAHPSAQGRAQVSWDWRRLGHVTPHLHLIGQVARLVADRQHEDHRHRGPRVGVAQHQLGHRG